jgi:hypothetical protein
VLRSSSDSRSIQPQWFSLEVEAPPAVVFDRHPEWRTIDFPPDARDSRLDLRLDNAATGIRITLIQRNLPPDQVDEYSSGWREYYFARMRAYFVKSAPPPSPRSVRKRFKLRG